jgi:glutamate--cysteine ligase catalytic subunit
MGLLDVGTPLSWAESIPYISTVKHNGLLQLINIHNTLQHRQNDHFLYGDELEYVIVKLDKQQKTARLVLKGKQVQTKLEKAMQDLQDGRLINALFHPEYAMYMIEATPYKPYQGFSSDLALIESNMELRRKLIQGALDEDEVVLSITNFPLLGVGEFCIPWNPELLRGPAANSEFIPDTVINDHPRFPYFT